MPASTAPRIAIIGAGIGGLAAAIALRRRGLDVQVHEQARAFARVGAGVQMLPNACHALRGLGLLDRLEAAGFQPYSHLNRIWDSGAVVRELPMPPTLYGAPFLCLHRAELHRTLAAAVPAAAIHLNRRLRAIEPAADGYRLVFADGTQAEADAVIGADGVHSVTRTLLFGPDAPLHKGRIAYRAVFPAARIAGPGIRPSRTKWWGEDRHIVIYYTDIARSEVYLVTSVPESGDFITAESWSASGDVAELRAAFSGFHPEVRAVLEACPGCHKWAILERPPMPAWGAGGVTLLGDACHPMTPYMAQGAATAIEDAVVLARCLDGATDIPAAFARYAATRQPRTARIQAISSANTWMHGGNDDPAWLYGYDAWSVPLAA
jgi:salicylate hydroxylase/6-hydroxynicotinate 3-monooxygenase